MKKENILSKFVKKHWLISHKHKDHLFEIFIYLLFFVFHIVYPFQHKKYTILIRIRVIVSLKIVYFS